MKAPKLEVLNYKQVCIQTTRSLAHAIRRDLKIIYGDNANLYYRVLFELSKELHEIAVELLLERHIPYWPTQAVDAPAPKPGEQAPLASFQDGLKP